MTQKIKFLATVIVVLLAGALIGYIVTPKRDRTHEDMIETQLRLKQHEIDEYRKKMINAQRRDSVWMAIETRYKDSLNASRADTKKWKKIYADIKNTPTPKYTESDLDSLISAIIR